MITIPTDSLSPAALRGLVEEFVTRDGTDYGTEETPLEQKIRAVLNQLASGEAIVCFDERMNSANIVLARELRA